MVATVLSYIVIAFISFVQGYTFVPQYVSFYAGFRYLGERGKSKLNNRNPISIAIMFCEIGSLCFTLLFLILIYHLYFEVAYVPQHINKVWLTLFVIGFASFRIKQEIEFWPKRAEIPVYVNYSHMDNNGRVALDSFWTLRDLERYLIKLESGCHLKVYGTIRKSQETEETLSTSGIVEWDEKLKCWFIAINWERELEKQNISDDSHDDSTKIDAISQEKEARLGGIE